MMARVILVGTLLTVIVIAHMFLWWSGMDTGLKITFTILNALGWTIVLAPMLLIDRWLDGIKAHNRGKEQE